MWGHLRKEGWLEKMCCMDEFSFCSKVTSASQRWTLFFFLNILGRLMSSHILFFYWMLMHHVHLSLRLPSSSRDTCQLMITACILNDICISRFFFFLLISFRCRTFDLKRETLSVLIENGNLMFGVLFLIWVFNQPMVLIRVKSAFLFSFLASQI